MNILYRYCSIIRNGKTGAKKSMLIDGQHLCKMWCKHVRNNCPDNKKKKDKLSALWRMHKLCLSLKRKENNLLSQISDTTDLIVCLYEHKESYKRIHMTLWLPYIISEISSQNDVVCRRKLLIYPLFFLSCFTRYDEAGLFCNRKIYQMLRKLHV